MQTAAKGEAGGGLGTPIPVLRAELVVNPGATGPDGAPTWVIHDPVRNKFISIDAVTYELLSLTGDVRTADELRAAMKKKFRRDISSEALNEFLRFLSTHQLAATEMNLRWDALADMERRTRAPFLKRLMHDYIFFRVHLFSPQRFLERTQWAVAFLFTKFFTVATVIFAFAGLYLTSRQSEQFFASFRDLWGWHGALFFMAGILVVKLLHELGHAYTAVRHGCRVSSIGIAFMMLTPMPYTDVSDAWRLKDRRKRRQIDSAGIKVELVVADYATFLWAFLPDGPIRSLAFALATTGWIMSVAVNLNPLMRFDGYYLLSDILKIENLHSRSFAIGRWWIREILFGLRQPPPEAFSRLALAGLAFFAYAVWVYRALLVIAIAAMLFHFAFKLLAVVLIAVEVVILLLKPIRAELEEWFAMRKAILRSRRTAVTAVLSVVAILAVVVPWHGTVVVPAVVELAEQNVFHAPRPARIVRVHAQPGLDVAAGDVLVVMESDEIDQQLRLARSRLKLVAARLSRQSVDRVDRADNLVLRQQRDALKVEIEGLERAASELVVTAPSNGRVLEIEPSIQPGRLIGTREPILWFGRPGHFKAVGFAPVEQINRIEVGTNGRFIADDARFAAWSVTLAEIGAAGVSDIDIKPLAAPFDGGIAVEPDAEGRLVPTAAQVRLRMDVSPSDTEMRSVMRGVVHFEGTPVSFAERAWRQVVRVFVREAGV